MPPRTTHLHKTSKPSALRSRLMMLLCLGASLTPLTGADVQISGLRSISNTEALSILTPRLVFINKRTAIPARANDAAFLLKQLLRKQGLPAAEVGWRIPNANTIILDVQEGPLRNIGNVTVNGVEKEKHLIKIQDYFLVPPEGTPLFSNNSIPYLEEAIQLAQKDSTQFLQSKGYWKATVALENKPNPADVSLVDIDVNIDLGPRFKLGAPLISGSLPTRNDALDTQIDSYTGRTADTETIIALRDLINNSLYKAGYNFAKVNVSQKLIGETLILELDITPGRTYRFGKLNITGNERTKKKRINQIVADLANKPYDRLLIQKKQKKLLSTGAFDALRITNRPLDDGTIDIDLDFNEGRARGVAGYTGVGSQEGFIIGSSVHDRNFLGNLWNLNIDTEFSTLGLLGQVRLTEPWFLGSDHQFSTRAWYLTRDYEGYDKKEAGLEASLEVDISKTYELKFFGNMSRSSITPTGIAPALIGNDLYNVYRLGLTQTWDHRNSKILPTRGFYAAMDTEIGIVAADDSTYFARVGARAGYYHRISENRHLAARAHFGSLISEGDNADFPIDLRYFLGGANTVRSFPYRELGPASGKYPTGGESYWSSSLEYIQKVKGPVNGLIFLDAGSLDQNTLSLGEAKYAIGLGLRVDLPIGPARLEYGYNLNQKSGEPNGALHFSFGLAF